MSVLEKDEREEQFSTLFLDPFNKMLSEKVEVSD